MVAGALAPVLLLHGDRLFLGAVKNGQRGSNVDLQGVLTDVKFTDRSWQYLAVVYDALANTLQLYHNGKLASLPFRLAPPDAGHLPRISPFQRALVFGHGQLLKGATGLIDRVMLHQGRVVSEIQQQSSPCPRICIPVCPPPL